MSTLKTWFPEISRPDVKEILVVSPDFFTTYASNLVNATLDDKRTGCTGIVST
jgi:hypothetical protein